MKIILKIIFVSTLFLSYSCKENKKALKEGIDKAEETVNAKINNEVEKNKSDFDNKVQNDAQNITGRANNVINQQNNKNSETQENLNETGQ